MHKESFARVIPLPLLRFYEAFDKNLIVYDSARLPLHRSRARGIDFSFIARLHGAFYKTVLFFISLGGSAPS